MCNIYKQRLYFLFMKEQKKKFLSQLAAVSNMSKADVNNLVNNAVLGKYHGNDLAIADKIISNIISQIFYSKINLCKTQQQICII